MHLNFIKRLRIGKGVSCGFYGLCSGVLILALAVMTSSCGMERTSSSFNSVEGRSSGSNSVKPSAAADTQPQSTLTIISEVQTFDRSTQVITAKGAVEIYHDLHNAIAKCDVAKYFQNEGYIELVGNASITQEKGHKIEAHTIKYYVNNGQAVAVPKKGQQVRSTIIFK